MFFSEEKNQKTLADAGANEGVSAACMDRGSIGQKSFASFLQKR